MARPKQRCLFRHFVRKNEGLTQMDTVNCSPSISQAWVIPGRLAVFCLGRVSDAFRRRCVSSRGFSSEIFSCTHGQLTQWIHGLHMGLFDTTISSGGGQGCIILHASRNLQLYVLYLYTVPHTCTTHKLHIIYFYIHQRTDILWPYIYIYIYIFT